MSADYHCSSSDSDDEVIGQYQEAVSRSQGLRGGSAGTNSRQQQGYGWDTRQKYCPLAAEYDGYSSEASADDGKFTPHTKKLLSDSSWDIYILFLFKMMYAMVE